MKACSESMQVQSKHYTADEAFAFCAQITNAHYENFPVASLFLPEEKRPYIQAIYAFSRIADDFADERSRPPEARLNDLNDWEKQLERCYEGNAEHPVFIALIETVKRNQIPIETLKNLLTAFKRDVSQNRYETFDDLLSYCKCSANPVGRLVLMIFGNRDEELFKLSDDICTSLQLANFWQDVAIDLKKDRLYIPLEDMKQYDYKLDDWKSGVMDEKFRQLMKFEIERTREMFYRGAQLLSLVEKELQFELKLIWFGGMTILRRIEKNQFDVVRRRPTLNFSDKFLILVRALFYNDVTRYGKKKESWELIHP